MLPWLLCGALGFAAAVLAVKVGLLHRAMDEIWTRLREKLDTDTNTLISLSSRDRHARRLASELNVELKELRDRRRQFQGGSVELKNAVANVSHDLRTPLTAIRGYLELLEREELSCDAARYVSIIDERARRMTELTQELFRYSVAAADGEKMRPEAVDLGAAIEECAADMYAAFKARGIEPQIRLPEERVIRTLDRGMVSRVLSNLLDNAAKYSAGDLKLELSDAGTITLSNSAPALDGVDVGRLFDRFYTVEASRGSAGLGLYIARTLTEKMGGGISARYGPEGLTIEVRFPQKDE